MNVFSKKRDEKLRIRLTTQAGFTLEEIPMVYAFIFRAKLTIVVSDLIKAHRTNVQTS